MPTRLPSRRRPPIGFAHRGGRAHAPENTLDAFRAALDLGATGLESDVWITADGIPVLDHDGVIRLRRRPIGRLERAELPARIPSLEELYAVCGTGFELALDVYDPRAVDAVVAVAGAAAGDAPGRLWLCHSDVAVVEEWRRFPDVHLVDSTRLRAMKEGPERRAARLSAAGIDAVNLPYNDWTGGHVTLMHRFELYAFGWDAQHDRVLDELLDMGIDGVFSDHVDRMMAAIARIT